MCKSSFSIYYVSIPNMILCFQRFLFHADGWQPRNLRAQIRDMPSQAMMSQRSRPLSPFIFDTEPPTKPYQTCLAKPKRSKNSKEIAFWNWMWSIFIFIFNSSDGTLTTHFDTTPKMSSYLIAFIVSDFDFKKGDKQLVHRVFSAPYLVNQTAYALAEGEVILDAIAKYVNVPYTMPKMDQAAIPQFRAGGTNKSIRIFFYFL